MPSSAQWLRCPLQYDVMLSTLPRLFSCCCLALGGAGGVTEMATKLDDTTVQFGLANFTLGSGSFKRDKLVFVHVQGEKAGAVAKGRLNTLKGAVKESMGATHAEVQLYSADECTPEHFIEHLGKVIKVDDMGGFSISKLTADYEAMIASAGPAGVPDALERAATRKTAAEMGTVEGSKALEAVKQPLGPFNWALFKASDKLELHNAGSMSVNEMTKWMAEDQVLFGLLRMGFGAGKFRRIKWICLHWAGEKVSPVKRGRANALKKDIMAKLGPFSLTVRRSSCARLGRRLAAGMELLSACRAGLVRGIAPFDDDIADTPPTRPLSPFRAAPAGVRVVPRGDDAGGHHRQGSPLRRGGWRRR